MSILSSFTVRAAPVLLALATVASAAQADGPDYKDTHPRPLQAQRVANAKQVSGCLKQAYVASMTQLARVFSDKFGVLPESAYAEIKKFEPFDVVNIIHLNLDTAVRDKMSAARDQCRAAILGLSPESIPSEAAFNSQADSPDQSSPQNFENWAQKARQAQDMLKAFEEKYFDIQSYEDMNDEELRVLAEQIRPILLEKQPVPDPAQP
mgnify:CR=1 FL=1